MAYDIKVELKDKVLVEHMVDKTKDDCLLCGQPLKNVYFEWNMFHGEVSSSCCKAPYQTKDFYVDDDKKDAYAPYFKEVNKPNIMSLSVGEKYIEPLKTAMQEEHIFDISNPTVRKRVQEIVG